MGPHGSATTAMFAGADDPLYRRIAEWADSLAVNASGGAIAESGRVDVRLAEVLPNLVPRMPQDPALPMPPVNVQRGAKLLNPAPRDPFDPAVFNRRFFPPAPGQPPIDEGAPPPPSREATD